MDEKGSGINIVRYLLSAGLMIVLIISFTYKAEAQELPPRPMVITVNLSQNLAFGTFAHGTIGGSVIIDSDGTRSATGDVVLLGISSSAALFDIEANPGTMISIANAGASFTLSGSNGGSMTLVLGNTNPTPIVITATPPAVNTISIGGTLVVGNSLANPPGSYSGTFDVIFVQE